MPKSLSKVSTLLIPVLAALLLVGCQPSGDVETHLAEAWPFSCQKLKAELGDRPGLDVRFTPLPEPASMPPVWSLRWDGHAVPVPAVEYRKLVVRRSATGAADPADMVMLVDGAGHNVFLSYSGGFEPTPDAFGKVDLQGGAVESDQEGVQLTELLWGRPVGLGEMIYRSYEAGLSDITCQPANWRAEMAASYGLILKSVAGDEVSHAHRLSEQPMAWLTRSRTPERLRWRASFLRDATPDLATDIEVWLPPQSASAEIGLLLGAGRFDAAPPPAWLAALQQALDRNDRPAWEALAAQLPAAGFDDKSQERLAAFIRERFEAGVSQSPHPSKI